MTRSCVEGTQRWVSAGGTHKAYITYKKTSITTSCVLSGLAPGAAFAHTISVLPHSWAKLLTFELWNPGGKSPGDLSRFYVLKSMSLPLGWRIASHAREKRGLATSSSWFCRRNSHSFGPAGYFSPQQQHFHKRLLCFHGWAQISRSHVSRYRTTSNKKWNFNNWLLKTKNCWEDSPQAVPHSLAK